MPVESISSGQFDEYGSTQFSQNQQMFAPTQNHMAPPQMPQAQAQPSQFDSVSQYDLKQPQGYPQQPMQQLGGAGGQTDILQREMQRFDRDPAEFRRSQQKFSTDLYQQGAGSAGMYSGQAAQ